jgi:hypothetical protein
MNTTAGSYSLLGSIVPDDATVIQKLRKAGAIILGEFILLLSATSRSFPNSTSFEIGKVLSFIRSHKSHLRIYCPLPAAQHV